MNEDTRTRPSVLQRGAEWVANRGVLPTSLRAVLGYYADSGVFDYSALQLKSQVDETIDGIVADANATVERALEREFGRQDVTFEYDTKLTMPAELTLGYVYRQIVEDAPSGVDPVADGEEAPGEFRQRVEHVEATTALVVEALLDGDMRDAVNDEEFEDFAVDFPLASEEERRRVAVVAQEALQSSIEERFESFPAAVREAYDWAVDVSERHQDRDDHFRELMRALESGEDGATGTVRADYKFATFEEPPALFDEVERDLPYLKTQYRRVGVIYDGMIDMYREAGFDVPDEFKKSIVLSIIGAQVWLDDVDDYEDDVAEGQLTPVTAEYLMADSDQVAYERVVEITRRYLELAQTYATRSGTPLTGIAVEYIWRMGDPSVLPGSS